MKNPWSTIIEVRKVVTYWGILTARSTRKLSRMMEMFYTCVVSNSSYQAHDI